MCTYCHSAGSSRELLVCLQHLLRTSWIIATVCWRKLWETSLLSTHCLLDQKTVLKSAAHGSQRPLGTIGAHLRTLAVASAASEALIAATAAAWGTGLRTKGSGSSGAKESPCHGILTEVEMEFALIKAMMWSAPIIADASGKATMTLDRTTFFFACCPRTSTISSGETEMKRLAPSTNPWIFTCR